MPIELNCSCCGKRYRVADDAAGKKIRCQSCQTLTVVPHLQAVDPSPSIATHTSITPRPTQGGKARSSTPTTRVPTRPAGSASGSISNQSKPPVSGAQPCSLQTSADSARTEVWADLSTPTSSQSYIRPIQSPTQNSNVLLKRVVQSPWTLGTGVLIFLFFLAFFSDNIAIALIGISAIIFLVGIIWAGVQSLYFGGRTIAGILIASPVLLLIVAAKSFKAGGRTNIDMSLISPVGLLMTILGTLTAIAMVVGFLKKPAAYLRSALLAALGLLFFVLSFVPPVYRRVRQMEGERAQVAMPEPSTFPFRELPPASLPPRQSWPQPETQSPFVRPNSTVEQQSQGSTATNEPGGSRPSSWNPTSSESMEVKWGGAWYGARVIKTKGEWTWIEYTSDASREWVEPWRMRATGSNLDDIPSVHPNNTWGKLDTSEPLDPPAPKPNSGR